MQGAHRHRKQIYSAKRFQIESLNSLVKMAKQRTIERVDSEISDNNSVTLPLHDITERLVNNLQAMHHQLESLLLEKLGPDARNVIAAERARKTVELEKFVEDQHEGISQGDLSGVAQEHMNELELLNEYRERYAAILAELLVAKDRLVEREKRIQEEEPGMRLRRRGNKKMIRKDSKGKAKRFGQLDSTASFSGLSSDESESPEPETSK
jgi:hypothetical protein